MKNVARLFILPLVVLGLVRDTTPGFANISTKTSELSEAGLIKLVVLGETSRDIGEAMELDTLANVDTTDSIKVADIENGGGRGPGNVVQTWRDIRDRVIHLRERPLVKVQEHNLTVGTIQRVTKLVDQKPSGQAFQYETPATEYRCGVWNCTVLRQQLVRVVVGFRDMDDGKTYGVISAYCLQQNKKRVCPGWVNAAINR